MLFFNFHIGDWITGTKLMSAIEKGVYMDLLTYYYSVERPITEDECKRIARAYAGAEQDAMQYVLQNHFAYVDGAYVHKRCEEIIAQTLEKQTDIRAKKQKAAHVRWEKERERKLAQAKIAGENAPAHTDAMQMDSTCNADAMLTDNHKPLTNINNHNKQLTEIFNEGREHEETELVDDDSIAIHAEVPEPVLDSNYDVGLYEETAIDQLERHVEDGLDKVIDDFNHVVTPMEVIALARLYGLKVPRDQRLNDACARKILTIDHVRKCIEICKNKAKSGYYLVGILRNAVNDPEQYHTVSYHLSSKKYELAPEDDTVF